MKTLKTLQTFANKHNLIVIPVTFRSQGIKLNRKGFDLCKPNGEIIATFEPCYADSYKWFISSYPNSTHVMRITNRVLCSLNIELKRYSRQTLLTRTIKTN